MKIYFDGGCRPNPGPMRTAVVAGGRLYQRADLGPGDNNDAEWLALVDALNVARALGVADAALLGDSAMVVNQATGAAPCRAARFQRHLREFHRLAAGFRRLRVRRISRSQNLAGIALERIYRELKDRSEPEDGGSGSTCRG